MDADSIELMEDVEAFILQITKDATEQQSLAAYQQNQAEDEICSRVVQYCKSGWPRKHLVPCELIPYWKLRSSLTIYDHILLFNERIVIPAAMQSDVMKTLHEGHQGVELCRMRARASVWWPGVNKQVAEMVQNCSQCAKVARQRST